MYAMDHNHYEQPPLHKQMAVHWRAAFLQLQRFIHHIWHLQEISSTQLYPASGNLVQYDVYLPPIIDQPQLVCEVSSGTGSSRAGPTHIHLGTLPSWHILLKLPLLEGSFGRCSSLQVAASWPCPCICWSDHIAGSQTSRLYTLRCLIYHEERRTVAAMLLWVLAVLSIKTTSS